LPKRSTQKAVVQRTLVKAAEPTRNLWASIAPYDASDLGLHLRDSVIVSTKTKSRQTLEGAHPGDVTIYIGPDKNLPHHHGIPMEFGTFKDRPQPSGRPAWEATKDGAFDILGFLMWGEIDATAQRLARRAARG
jgi:hypothetical protein